MSEVRETKTSVAGRKNVTTQILSTPFGDMRVEIKVGGYKSSEGDEVFSPPADTDELDGAEEQTGESE